MMTMQIHTNQTQYLSDSYECACVFTEYVTVSSSTKPHPDLSTYIKSFLVTDLLVSFCPRIKGM